jgi:hypothetical protein
MCQIMTHLIKLNALNPTLKSGVEELQWEQEAGNRYLQHSLC